MKKQMFDRLVPQISNVLSRYDIRSTNIGIEANLDDWWKRKKRLLDLLRKHPDWDEEALAVKFDITETNDINRVAVDNALGRFTNYLYSHDVKSDALTVIRGVARSYEKNITNKILVESVKLHGYKAAVGQATTRIIRGICRQENAESLPNFESEYDKLAKTLSPIVIKRPAYLSVHPCDFLKMSANYNEFGWTSCHRFGGIHASGTLSYMNDGVSMIFYTVSRNDSNESWNKKKVTRQHFAYNGKGVLLQSCLYGVPATPFSEAIDQYRAIVQDTIATAEGLPNTWVLTRKMKDIRWRTSTTKRSTHYPDYEYQSKYPTISLMRSAEKTATSNSFLKIGALPKCLLCGAEHSIAGNLTCYGRCQERRAAA